MYRRGPEQCAYWLGAISSTGHGKFRAGSRARTRPEAEPSRIVTAHVYAYQLDHGALPTTEAGRKDPGRRLSAGQARAALRAIQREHDTAQVQTS